MYSMVLMAALTTGTDLPDWGRRGGCCGCYGGWGWGGCYGGWGGYGGWGYGYGGLGGGYGGWGGGYGGRGGYVYAPLAPTYAAPMFAYNTLPAANLNTRSMYYNPAPSDGNRATIIVHLPETATLTVDGKPTSSTSATRRFYSPPLEPGRDYHYNFEARMERDGKAMKADKSVDVHAGDQLEIYFNESDLNQTERQGSAAPSDQRGTRNRQVRVDRR
jgi:uncharacterized protein (TIGR03000 family)